MGSDPFPRARRPVESLMSLGRAVAVVLVACLASSCAGAGAPGTNVVTGRTKSGKVELTFPSGWSANPEEHPFDLQWRSKFERMNTGVFEFLAADLAEDYEAKELLAMQVEDLRSKRENFEVFVKETVTELPDKRLTTVSYAGEKASQRNLYRFTLVEFTGHREVALVILQVSFPTEWEESRAVLEAITASARLVEPATAGTAPER